MAQRKRWLYRFIPADADAFQIFRAEALLAFCGLVLPLSLIWGITHLLDGAWTAALLYLVVIATVVGSLFELHRSKNLTRVTRIALMVGLTATIIATYLTGGLRLTNVSPFLLLIVAYVLLLGREGIYWSIFSLVCALLFQLGHWVGYVYPDSVPLADRPLDAFLTWLSSAVLLMLWVASYERARRATMRTLAEREQRIRQLFESTPDVALVHDFEGRLLDANEVVVDLLGYTREELSSMRLTQITPPQAGPRVAELLGQLRQRDRMVFEGVLRNKQGGDVAVEIHARTLLLDGETTVFALIRDIRDRNAAEAERKHLQEQLLQAQKMESIGRLAGGVAHDFNNLLTTIIGYCEMLRRHESLSEQGSQDLSEVRRAAHRAASLTQQLLAFSRKQLIAPRVVELGQVVERSANMLRRFLGEQVVLTMHRTEQASWANVDPNQIEQLLLNLVLNARDAMPDGGEMTIDVGPAETDDGPRVLLQVHDTGTGMDAETARQAFDPFFTTKEVGKGSGLGLATVYGVVKQNGGHVEVETAPGEGSTFRIFLPTAAPPDDEADSHPPTPQAMPSPVGRERILLVEDEEDVRSLAERVLSSAGYLVTSAAEGDAAAREAQAAAAPFDLLVTDVVMPGGDGASLYKRLHALQPSLRVLYCSGYSETVLAERGAELGDELLLSKPYSPTELLLRVRKRLDE